MLEQVESEQVTRERMAVRQYLSGMDAENQVQKRIIAVQMLNKEFIPGSFLWKFFPCIKHKKTVTAVKDLTFGLQENKVFGLIGHRGCGKTATMRMIMGRTTPTSGRVVVNGEDMQPKDPKGYTMIGYCPQSDALWNVITVEEHFDVYATVNGVKQYHFREHIDQIMRDLELDDLRDFRIRSLTLGQMRKVSYGLSLLGYSKLTVLDEPTKFMHIDDKQLVWNSIRRLKKTQKGVLISTNNIAEGYQVCDRIGFMVHGTIKNLGEPLYLKEAFGIRYFIELTIKDDEFKRQAKPRGGGLLNYDERWNKIERELKRRVKDVTIRQRERVVFKCNFICESTTQAVSSRLPKLFDVLEDLLNKGMIKDYVVSQTTLERAFLDLEKLQEEYDSTEAYLETLIK